MSIQPLMPLSNNYDSHILREIVSFAELLRLQPDIESQISAILRTYKRLFLCDVFIWLAKPYSVNIDENKLFQQGYQLSNLTENMTHALEMKSITISDTREGFSQFGIALPLIVEDEVIGIVELDRQDHTAFSPEELAFVHDLGVQASLLLDWKTQRERLTRDKKMQEYREVAEKISKSIISNLDINNLRNSLVTLLHNAFGVTMVELYTPVAHENMKMELISRSHQGLEISVKEISRADDDLLNWVALHREPVTIEDTSADNRYKQSIQDKSLKSIFTIPIISGETLEGILSLSNDTIGSFSDELIAIITFLADAIALSLRNARLYHHEILRKQVTDSMVSLISEVSVDTTSDKIIDLILHELEKSLPYDASAIWLFDEHTSGSGIERFTSTLRLASVQVSQETSIAPTESNRLKKDVIRDFILQVDEESVLLERYTWLSELLFDKRPRVIDTTQLFEPVGESLLYLGEYSALGIPLIYNEQPLGLIVVVHHLPDQYLDDSLFIATVFSAYASIVIENARLFIAAHDHTWMSTVLLQAAEISQSVTTVEELLDSISKVMLDLVGASACVIYLWDSSMRAFSPQTAHGFTEEQWVGLQDWDIELDTVLAFGKLHRTKQPVILTADNISQEFSAVIMPSHETTSSLLILFPIPGSEENVAGAVLVDLTNTKLEMSSPQKAWDDMFTIIQGVIHQASLSIGNLQLLKVQEEEAYISVALLQVAQAIVSLTHLDDILSSIVRITPILVGVKRCAVYLWEKDHLVFRLAPYYGFSRNELQFDGEFIHGNEFLLLEEIFNRNQIAYYQLPPLASPTMWSDIRTADLNFLDSTKSGDDEQLSIRLDVTIVREEDALLLGFPLSTQGEALGVMLVEEERPGREKSSFHIREKRIEIVNGIAQQAALAIKNDQLQKEAVNSERMERELQLARDIQRTFLPERVPWIPGWDLDVHWKPARQVGGDFYDFLKLGENRLGIVIADVADKGMPAALFMTLIRTLIRAAAKENDSPAVVLKQVNELLYQDSKNGMFVTVFYGVIDCVDGSLVYANAGHNPPIIRYDQSNEMVELTRTTMALGIFPEIDVDECRVFMKEEDWLLLYTDGVTEAFSVGDEMFSVNRLFELIAGRQFISAKELLETIEHAVYSFIEGAELSDDITIVAIKKSA